MNNVIVYTEQDFACLFDPVGDAPEEEYVGEIRKVGIDLQGLGASLGVERFELR